MHVASAQSVSICVHPWFNGQRINWKRRRFETQRCQRSQRRHCATRRESEAATNQPIATERTPPRRTHVSLTSKNEQNILKKHCQKSRLKTLDFIVVTVHRAAANNFDFKIRATRGSDCNGLLSSD
jgi:hypothetical protein